MLPWPAAPTGSKDQSSVMLWVTGSLRLFMEWMMVPIFAVALQVHSWLGQ